MVQQYSRMKVIKSENFSLSTSKNDVASLQEVVFLSNVIFQV